MVIYMSIFAFHFLVLSNSGNGDGFFSSEFQSTLIGNELYEHSVPECMLSYQFRLANVVWIAVYMYLKFGNYMYV